jgi:hypothetical protein
VRVHAQARSSLFVKAVPFTLWARPQASFHLKVLILLVNKFDSVYNANSVHGGGPISAVSTP